MGRNIRSGNFDFYLAQPGNVMFMATTRKLDPDSLLNSIVAAGVVIDAARQLGLDPTFGQIVLYALMVLCGVVIHYSILVLSISLAFWLTSAQGIEGIYFTLTEFSRLPAPRSPASPRRRSSFSAPACRDRDKRRPPGCSPKASNGNSRCGFSPPPPFGSPRPSSFSTADCVATPAQVLEAMTHLCSTPAPYRLRISRPNLLVQAVTHPSYLVEHRASPPTTSGSNFSGDAVLQLVLTEALFNLFQATARATSAAAAPPWSRVSSSLRSPANSASTLACCLARSELNSGGRERASGLADACEALFGALSWTAIGPLLVRSCSGSLATCPPDRRRSENIRSPKKSPPGTRPAGARQPRRPLRGDSHRRP